MARGVQPGRQQLIEEAHCEARSIIAADVEEIGLLRELWDSVKDRPASDPVRRVAAQLITHDRSENSAHREFDDLVERAMRSA